MMKDGTMYCDKCGGVMKKSRQGRAGGCLLMVLGFIGLFFFPVGTIIGAIFILAGLIIGTKADYYWACTQCGYQFSRKKDWWELW